VGKVVELMCVCLTWFDHMIQMSLSSGVRY